METPFSDTMWWWTPPLQELVGIGNPPQKPTQLWERVRSEMTVSPGEELLSHTAHL